MQMQSLYGSAYTRRRNVRGKRLHEASRRRRARREGKEWTEGERRKRRRRRREKKRDPHSRRLSCSPSAYHGVRGQDLYVEFIVAESALLRFMDVFRRSAAARVIYRGTLALPPSPSRSVTKLFSPFSLCSLALFLSFSPLFSRVLPRSDSVHEGGAEGDGGIPNERYDGISFPLCLSFPLPSLVGSLVISLSLFHFLSRCATVSLFLSDSFL